MTGGLLDWAENPSGERGFSYFDGHGGWQLVSYAELAGQIQSVAGGIVEQRRGGRGPIALVLPSGADFAGSFFATLWAGNTPCPIAPPTFLRDLDEYVEHLARLLSIAEPALIVVDPGLREAVSKAVKVAAVDAAVAEPPVLAAHDPLTTRSNPAELALLQFTSGSSEAPRGVRVSWANLEANVGHIIRWTEAKPGETCATWLPLYHDMGLIGCFLACPVADVNLQIMRPEQFVLDPARWLECFGREGAALTAAPTFAFAYCTRRVTAERLDGMDFSGWRGAIIGAERVDAEALSKFAERLSPYGFKTSTFMPAYGLAEATLAVTGTPLARQPKAVRFAVPDPTAPNRVAIDQVTQLSASQIAGQDGVWLVSSGEPLGEIEAEVIDATGRRLPDDQVGQIVVRGETVAQGYLGEAKGESTRFTADSLFTGDAGFYHQGELYVLGRIGDSVKLRGRSIYMEDIEDRLVRLPELSVGKLVAFAGTDADGPTVAVLVEGEPGAWVAEAERILGNQLGEDMAVCLLSGPRGSIVRTSSGKPRRRTMWERWRCGELDAVPVGDAVAAGR